MSDRKFWNVGFLFSRWARSLSEWPSCGMRCGTKDSRRRHVFTLANATSKACSLCSNPCMPWWRGDHRPWKRPLLTRYLTSQRWPMFGCSCLFVIAFGRAFSFKCLYRSLFTTGLWPGFDGGAGLVQEVHALRKCQRPDAGLGPLLSRIQTHLKTAPSGEKTIRWSKNRH